MAFKEKIKDFFNKDEGGKMGKGKTIAIVVLSIALVASNFYWLYTLGDYVLFAEDYLDDCYDALEDCNNDFWEMSDLANYCYDLLDEYYGIEEG